MPYRPNEGFLSLFYEPRKGASRLDCVQSISVDAGSRTDWRWTGIDATKIVRRRLFEQVIIDICRNILV